jgi:hypothetical protein
MSWTPIQDIPDPEEALEVSELRALDELWSEQRSELEQLDGMKRFRVRLARSWAIETGVIERVFDLDRGTTDLLIEKGIDADLIDRASTDREPRLVGRIIRDHRDAIEGLFTFIKRERDLSTSYVKELHATLTRSQETVLFQINYREAPQEAAERFRDWLEEVMTIGLDRWRSTLARSIR